MNQQLDLKEAVLTALIDQLKKYNKSIGSYEKSLMNADFNYAVKLTNGKIEITDELLSDFESDPFSIDKDRLRAAASFFIPKTDHQLLAEQRNQEPVSYGSNKTSTMKLALVLGLLVVGGIAVFLNQHTPEKGVRTALNFEAFREKTPEELRQELLAKERLQPELYLSNEGTWRKTLFGKTILEGSVSNIATLADFKDITLEVKFLAKTGAEINTAQYVLYEFVSAGGKVNYKLRIKAPSATNAINIRIADAKQAN